MPNGAVDTSIYPQANPINILQTYGQAQGIANAQQQNQLLHTENQRAQVGLSQDKVNLAHQQYGILSGTLGTLAQDPRIATPAGFDLLHQTTDQLVKSGIITPDIAQAELANAPSDPSQLPQYLQTLNTRVLDAQGKFGEIYGQPGTISNGNRIIPVTTSPIAGVKRIGADIPMETGPSERNALVHTIGPQGQDIVAPQGQVVQKAGNNALTGMPMGPVNQLGQMSAPAAPSSIQPQAGGGAAISPPAGQVDSMVHTAVASTDKYNADQQREANFQQDMLPLNKAFKGMQALGTTGTGPGTETLNDVKSFLVSQGVINQNDDVKNFDEVRKYTTQLARTNGDTGSDSRLAASFAGNPSVNISNAAAQDVLKSAISLRKLQNAQVQAFSQSGLPASEYQKWAQSWNKSQDPVAYGFDLMEPAQRVKYIKSLSPEKKTAFVQSLTSAVQLGLVERPSATTPENGVPNGG
jgi:hypothetical protein